ncbi:phosphatidate cytidylyltransferase [Umboniibacter marinipuniceus]|uniref:Phosphatidate cytidylyltransferase n=1 Tax=Umboniibacter marinipuniceus TaxID=569599 RepID=A0A3M0A213_9GAMM|nr:phosphatidate cytidylyltransferase [Umboniibacter marinipuniceus]RMA78677.1 phosphatidate cytidylyltransferase [Umboniibacter marinipuniceus]
MLKQRVITAVVIAALFIAGVVYSNPLQGTLFLAVVWLLGAWEWAQLAAIANRWVKAVFVGFVALVMVALHWLTFDGLTSFDIEVVRTVFIGASLVWGVLFLWIQGYPSSATIWRHPVVVLTLGILVLVPAWYAMVLLKLEQNYAVILIAVLLMAVGNDTGAFAVGKTIGKHKLAKEVSPKKTWEGFFGGVVLGSIVGVLIGYLLGLSASEWKGWILATLAAIVGSVIGDLAESMFKRQAGVKDSGVLLPGHGGFLDRLDSLSAAFPLFALVYFFEFY